MNCKDIKGVKAAFLTFRPCMEKTGRVFTNIRHLLADDGEMPTYNTCPYKTDAHPGYTKLAHQMYSCSFSVVPHKEIPSAYYLGCAEIDFEIEYFDGRVLSGRGGINTTSSGMTDEKVTLDLRLNELKENR